MNYNEMTHSELVDLLYAYDGYIQSANEDDRYKTGWYPVCIAEFYDNDMVFYAPEEEEEEEGK